MVGKSCEICEANNEEVRLFDGIYEGHMSTLCERCSIVENIPIIKKPDSEQLKESEQIVNVHDRMKRLSGIKDLQEKETFFREDKLNELDSNPQLEMPEVEKLNLLDNFHWNITKNRRRKGLSEQQLATSLGESETSIQMVEKAKLPENAETLIKKLEQFFQIKLTKQSEIEKIIDSKTYQPSLLDEEGRELQVIPEEELEPYEPEEVLDEKDSISGGLHLGNLGSLDTKSDISKEFISEQGVKDFDLKKDSERVTIGDLQKIHRKKIEVTKEEQKIEQEKIEERRRFLEALRESDRLKVEQKQQQEQEEKQLAEQKQKQLIEQRQQALRELREKESKDVDQYLGGSELLKDKENNNYQEGKKEDSDSREEFDELF